MNYYFFLNLRLSSEPLEYCYDVVTHRRITKTRKDNLCTIQIIIKRKL